MLARPVVAGGEVRRGRAAAAARAERLQLPLADPAGHGAHGGGQPTRPRRIDCRQWLLRRSRSWCRRTTRPRASPPRCARCTRRSTRLGLEHEILVVDNASTDGTADARRGARRPGGARPAQPGEPRQGRVAAARDARGAGRRCGCTATPTAARRVLALGRMVELAERSTSSSARGWRRAPTSAAASRSGGGSPAAASGCCAARVLREPTRDLFCGFKLWRAPAAEAAYRATALTGWTFDAETLAMARALGFSITETGIPWTDREGSRLSMPRVIVPVTRELLEARRRVRGSRGRSAAAPAGELVEAAEPRRVSAAAAGWTRARRPRSPRWRRSRSRCSAGCSLKVWLRGGVVTGADGFLVADPLQYLDWSRQAGEHGLIGNRHDLAPGDRAFLHPGLLLSGAGVAAGRRPGRRLPAVEAGRGRRAVRRDARARAALPGAARRPAARARARAVLVLAGRGARRLGRAGRRGDEAAGRLRHRRAVVGLVPVGLPVHRDRGRAAAAGAARLRAGARLGGRLRRPPGGLLCAWLQPWQGATFAFTIAAAELVLVLRRGAAVRRGAARATSRSRSRPPPRRSSTTRCSARYDAAGRSPPRSTTCRAGRGGRCSAGLAPLALPAAFAYRLPAPDFGAVALRAWPLAALVVYFQPFGTFPFHALQGLTPPLVVLGVLALRAWLGERPVRLAARGGGGARARGRRHRVPRREPRRRRPRRAPAVHADGGRARRAAPPRRAARSRAACSRRSTPGSLCRPTRAARPGSAPARGRRPAAARRGGRGAVRRAAGRGRGRGAGAPLGRALRARATATAAPTSAGCSPASPTRRAGSAARRSGACADEGAAVPARRRAARARGAARSSATTWRS